jgi:hypothetical protein
MAPVEADRVRRSLPLLAGEFVLGSAALAAITVTVNEPLYQFLVHFGTLLQVHGQASWRVLTAGDEAEAGQPVPDHFGFLDRHEAQEHMVGLTRRLYELFPQRGVPGDGGEGGLEM